MLANICLNNVKGEYVFKVFFKDQEKLSQIKSRTLLISNAKFNKTNKSNAIVKKKKKGKRESLLLFVLRLFTN